MAAETAEQRAAELAELRRLTPEQEAAAAKAAQRIGEVAAAAEAAPRWERDWVVRLRRVRDVSRYLTSPHPAERRPPYSIDHHSAPSAQRTAHRVQLT